MVVRYWTDKITEEMLAVDFEPNGKVRLTRNGYPVRCATDYNLTFFENISPTAEEVEHYIIKNAPTSWLKLREEVLDPNVKTDLQVVKDMINVKKSFEVNI